MKSIYKYIFAASLALGSSASLVSCSKDKDDDVTKEEVNNNGGNNGQTDVVNSEYIKFVKDYSNFTITATTTSHRIRFTASKDWTATCDASYVKLSQTSGTASEDVVFLTFDLDGDNEGNPSREFKITITAGGKSSVVTVKQEGNDVVTIDPATIPDLDKFYKPQEFTFDMFKSSSKYSFARYKQSEHFFLFWEEAYGDDPKSYKHSVDVDDILQKCEKFYKTNVETLKMTTIGEGKSYLDQYKMLILVLSTDEWVCVGSGYDNVIGALWVNWQPCQPAGSSVAHEVGHSFQYTVFCDKIKAGTISVANQGAPTTDEAIYGWRYGFGPKSDQGGCAYWEQCAQWQSFQDYPNEAIGQSYNLFTQNCHRHFHHEWMRYQSYWFQYYLTETRGIESFGELWRESKYPEDALQTYCRLYHNGDLASFWDDYYNYAKRTVVFDFKAIHQYYNSGYNLYNTSMLNVDGKYRPSYSKCPSTSGFNVIQLNPVSKGETVSVDISALPVGCELAASDAGNQIDVDGKIVATVKNYNSNEYFDRSVNTTSSQADYRLGFVAVKGNTATYGDMATLADGKASMTMADNYDELYLVVVATPKSYTRQWWNDKEADDIQWPYEVSFQGTSLLGNVDITPGDPSSVDVECEVECDASTQAYELGTINLLSKGVMNKIANAFKMQPSEIAAACNTPVANTTGKPAEGKVIFGLTQPDGSISYSYTANVGFWCDAMGNAKAYGNSAPVYCEYTPSTYTLSYGHKGGLTKAGDTYVIKPTFTYIKGGVTYNAVVKVTMKF